MMKFELKKQTSYKLVAQMWVNIHYSKLLDILRIKR